MIEFRSLRENEFEQWLEHCTYVFSSETSQSHDELYGYFKMHYENDPWRDINKIFIAVENSVILSALKVIDRDIVINGFLIKAGGVAEVCTRPECGGKGYSSDLLWFCIKVMEEQGYQMSMLMAGMGLPNFYRKFGYEEVRLNKSILKVSVQHQLQKAYTCRTAIFPQDLNSIIKIYESYSYRCNGIIARNSRFYWENWFIAEAKTVLVACLDSGEVIGYICGKPQFIKDDDSYYMRISEFGCKNGFEDVLEYLTAEYIKRSPEEVQKSGKVILPSLVSSNPQDSTEIVTDDKRMVRMITSFEVGDYAVRTTGELVELLEGNNQGVGISKYLLWDVDNF